MKNELGIEVCCENCENAFDSCYGDKEEVCQSQDYCFFIATTEAYEKRIKELQAQLSNSMVILDEKEFIKTMKNRLEGWDGKIQKIDNTILEIAKSKTQECNDWFNTHQNKKKIEQTL